MSTVLEVLNLFEDDFDYQALDAAFQRDPEAWVREIQALEGRPFPSVFEGLNARLLDAHPSITRVPHVANLLVIGLALRNVTLLVHVVRPRLDSDTEVRNFLLTLYSEMASSFRESMREVSVVTLGILSMRPSFTQSDLAPFLPALRSMAHSWLETYYISILSPEAPLSWWGQEVDGAPLFFVGVIYSFFKMADCGIVKWLKDDPEGISRFESLLVSVCRELEPRLLRLSSTPLDQWTKDDGLFSFLLLDLLTAVASRMPGEFGPQERVSVLERALGPRLAETVLHFTVCALAPAFSLTESQGLSLQTTIKEDAFKPDWCLYRAQGIQSAAACVFNPRFPNLRRPLSDSSPGPLAPSLGQGLIETCRALPEVAQLIRRYESQEMKMFGYNPLTEYSHRAYFYRILAEALEAGVVDPRSFLDRPGALEALVNDLVSDLFTFRAAEKLEDKMSTIDNYYQVVSSIVEVLLFFASDPPLLLALQRRLAACPSLRERLAKYLRSQRFPTVEQARSDATAMFASNYGPGPEHDAPRLKASATSLSNSLLILRYLILPEDQASIAKKTLYHCTVPLLPDPRFNQGLEQCALQFGLSYSAQMHPAERKLHVCNMDYSLPGPGSAFFSDSVLLRRLIPDRVARALIPSFLFRAGCDSMDAGPGMIAALGERVHLDAKLRGIKSLFSVTVSEAHLPTLVNAVFTPRELSHIADYLLAVQRTLRPYVLGRRLTMTDPRRRDSIVKRTLRRTGVPLDTAPAAPFDIVIDSSTPGIGASKLRDSYNVATSVLRRLRRSLGKDVCIVDLDQESDDGIEIPPPPPSRLGFSFGDSTSDSVTLDDWIDIDVDLPILPGRR